MNRAEGPHIIEDPTWTSESWGVRPTKSKRAGGASGQGTHRGLEAQDAQRSGQDLDHAGCLLASLGCWPWRVVAGRVWVLDTSCVERSPKPGEDRPRGRMGTRERTCPLDSSTQKNLGQAHTWTPQASGEMVPSQPAAVHTRTVYVTFHTCCPNRSPPGGQRLSTTLKIHQCQERTLSTGYHGAHP